MEPYFHWDVSPEIVTIGPFVLRWYGVCFALAFVVGLIVITRVFRREGKGEKDIDRLLVAMLAGTILGARLGHCLLYEPAYFLSHPAEIPLIWKGGLASHGAVAGMAIALWIYQRRRPDQPFLWLLDRVAITAAPGACLIRMGNLFNSEIVGVPTTVPWAFLFARVDRFQARHPAQLYEALSYLAIFVLLALIYRRTGKATPRGLLLGVLFVSVFTARFFIEFLKERQAAFGEDFFLSMGQILSIPLVAIGLLLILRALAAGRKAPPVGWEKENAG
jgi:phosphatidylglycerol---prolipoprotein diacylglyceryl transferase